MASFLQVYCNWNQIRKLWRPTRVNPTFIFLPLKRIESKVFLVLSICCTFIFSSSECCAAYRAGAGENSKPNTSYPGAFPVGYPLAATVSPLPPPPFNLLRTCFSPVCKSGILQYFMSIKYFIHFVMCQVRLWNGERSNVFGFSSRASEFHRSWFLRWYVIAITVRFLKCI